MLSPVEFFHELEEFLSFFDTDVVHKSETMKEISFFDGENETVEQITIHSNQTIEFHNFGGDYSFHLNVVRDFKLFLSDKNAFRNKKKVPFEIDEEKFDLPSLLFMCRSIPDEALFRLVKILTYSVSHQKIIFTNFLSSYPDIIKRLSIFNTNINNRCILEIYLLLLNQGVPLDIQPVKAFYETAVNQRIRQKCEKVLRL